MDFSNYSVIPILPNTYNIVSNIELSKLTPYAEEIIGGHHCWFRHNRSPVDRIFIRRILAKKWE
jgi:hypothetical protein